LTQYLIRDILKNSHFFVYLWQLNFNLGQMTKLHKSDQLRASTCSLLWHLFCRWLITKVKMLDKHFSSHYIVPLFLVSQQNFKQQQFQSFFISWKNIWKWSFWESEKDLMCLLSWCHRLFLTFLKRPGNVEKQF